MAALPSDQNIQSEVTLATAAANPAFQDKLATMSTADASDDSDSEAEECLEDERQEKQICWHPTCDKSVGRRSVTGLCPTHRNWKSRQVRSALKELVTQETGQDIHKSFSPLPAVLQIPALPEPERQSILQLRENDQAVLYACQDAYEEEAVKARSLKIIDAQSLRPFALTNDLGSEENALANESVIQRILSMQRQQHGLIAHSIEPRKRRRIETESVVVMEADLAHVLRNGPYWSFLSTRKYVELSEDICDLLNDDWLVRPQMRFFCARALAGAILVNGASNEALLINTIEVYGRTSFADCHHERSHSKKGVPATSTAPPSFGTRYKEVWVPITRDNDGTKLHVATMVFNGLVTSSLRVDKKENPNVGPSTSNFTVKDPTASSRIRIFLDESSYNAAALLAKDPSATSVQMRDTIFQLRQVRSKFSHPNTYIPSRASSSITNYHRFQPYTVFSYASFDNGNPDTDGKVASMLFANISHSILRHGDEAILKKKEVMALQKSRVADQHVHGILGKILQLFTENNETIMILNNKTLNSHLTDLASTLTSYLAAANKIVANDIEAHVNSFN